MSRRNGVLRRRLSTHAPAKLHSITPNDAQSDTTSPSAVSPRAARATNTHASISVDSKPDVLVGPVGFEPTTNGL